MADEATQQQGPSAKCSDVQQQPPPQQCVTRQQPQPTGYTGYTGNTGHDLYRQGYDQQPTMGGSHMMVNVTNVTGPNPNQLGAAAQVGDGLRNWSSSICGCCDDITSCCLVYWFCPCYLCCCMSHRFGESCCAPFCLAIAGQSAPLVYRTKMRAVHGIRGGAIEDCCISTGCCMTCAVCQMKRELDFIERSTGKPAFIRHQ